MGGLEAKRRLFEELAGGEVMLWTSGGHYFRGVLKEVSDAGFLILEGVSCTLAGERGEREKVLVDLSTVEAVS